MPVAPHQVSSTSRSCLSFVESQLNSNLCKCDEVCAILLKEVSSNLERLFQTVTKVLWAFRKFLWGSLPPAGGYLLRSHYGGTVKSPWEDKDFKCEQKIQRHKGPWFLLFPHRVHSTPSRSLASVSASLLTWKSPTAASNLHCALNRPYLWLSLPSLVYFSSVFTRQTQGKVKTRNQGNTYMSQIV